MIQLGYTIFHPVTDLGVFFSLIHRVEDLAYTPVQDNALAATESQPSDDVVQRLLGEIFTRHNDGSQPGRSMSVGDVVTIEGCGTYAVESCGWRQLHGAESTRFARGGRSIRTPVGGATPATH